MFANAHKYKDRVELRYEMKQGKVVVLPIKPAKKYSYEHRQHLIFDAESELSTYFAYGHGPGGSAANRNKNAVILRHRPSEITVRSSKFRDQKANIRFAVLKINAYLEYYLLGKHCRLGRVLERKHEKHLGKMDYKKRRQEEAEKESDKRISLLEFYTQNGPGSIEGVFHTDIRDGGWQWILRNGGKRVLHCVLPIPTEDTTQSPRISFEDFRKLLEHSMGLYRVKLTVSICLEVFGVYLSEEETKSPLCFIDLNEKRRQHAIRCKQKEDQELFTALFDRLVKLCELIGGTYEYVAKDLKYKIS